MTDLTAMTIMNCYFNFEVVTLTVGIVTNLNVIS